MNWTKKEDERLRELLRLGYSTSRIAEEIHRTRNSIHLYCYRHRIPFKKQLERPLMRMLLDVKFGNVEYFHPTKDFFQRVHITTHRWAALTYGYSQPTIDELLLVSNELNINAEEALKLLNARQMDLFNE